MASVYKIRRSVVAIIALIALAVTLLTHPDLQQSITQTPPQDTVAIGSAADSLAQLPVKGRAAKTGYERTQFGDGWIELNGCDTRNRILNRDLVETAVNEKCQVVSGTLHDPYTGKTILFSRGETSSQTVQIDHVVALSNAWQTGAQALTMDQRIQLANDPLELLAVDGLSNQQKSDGDAATWLPPNKAFRCQYVARQIAVKAKYQLWVTVAEKDAMSQVLLTCPGQRLPVE